jgi:DNA-binding NarL/FixJ family response regulator
MSNDCISVCIIHPNQKISATLCTYLNKAGGFKCAGMFVSEMDALEKITKISPDVILLDVLYSGMGGTESIKKLKAAYAYAQLMMYTACDDAATVLAAFKAGATAYILSDSPPAELAGHIRELYNGGSPVSSSITRKLILNLQQPEINNQEKYSITKREKEILLRLDKGESYNAIADSLFISSKTVRKHIYNIYGKLHASCKIEAVNRFFGRGA